MIDVYHFEVSIPKSVLFSLNYRKAVAMKLPTITDVALKAGVSYATADRVLNKRGNVAPKSVQKVQKAVEQLGFIRNHAAANLSRQRMVRLAYVIPHRTDPFFRRMHEKLHELAAQLLPEQIVIEVISFEAFDHDGLNRALGKLFDTKGMLVFDGVTVVGMGHGADHPALTKIRSLGKPVVSLISDLPLACRDHYIGIDNLKAGRTAARLIGMSHGGQDGRVVLAVGSLLAHEHAERARGFQEVLTRDFPNVEIIQTVETLNQSRTANAHFLKLLDGGNVTGLYNTGAGNDVLIDALRNAEMSADVFCIVHELSDAVLQGLKAGDIDIVIDQSPEVELKQALDVLRATIDGRPLPVLPELTPAIYLRDNLPSHAGFMDHSDD